MARPRKPAAGVRSTGRSLGLVALLGVGVLAGSTCTRSAGSAAHSERTASPGERDRERRSWLIHEPVSPCDGMPWFASLVRDLNADGRDDLLLGCSNKLTVSLGAPSTLTPELHTNSLDRLLSSAALVAREPAPVFVLGGRGRASVVVLETVQGARGWAVKTTRVELDDWRDSADETDRARVELLDDRGALDEGIAYAAGPGALVELEWRSAAAQPGALHVLRSWPIPATGELERLTLADLDGDGAQRLVLLAQRRPRTNRCALQVVEWPTRVRDGRLELGEPRTHTVQRACASLPGELGGEPGVPLRLERAGVGLLRRRGDPLDVQLELAPLGQDTTPVAIFTHRLQPASRRRLCAQVVSKQYAVDPSGVDVWYGLVSTYLVEDGVITGIRSAPLPEGFVPAAIVQGDFNGDERTETLWVNDGGAPHILSRGLGRGCAGPMQDP
ncbi:MAG: hypothetical protein H6713_04035 [Myxococcales bacterium]|nr:hypothetical protein [Myxococcales bacterium]